MTFCRYNKEVASSQVKQWPDWVQGEDILRGKILEVLVMATFLTACSACSAIAISRQGASSGIQAALAKRAHARQVKDLTSYMATFTPDWETVNVVGRVVTYTTLRQSMAVNFASAQGQGTGTIQSHVVQVTVAGRSAQVTVDTRFNYPVVRAASGPLYRYKDTIALEVWVQGSAGWQEKREHYLSDSSGVSAKPVPMAKRGPRSF